MRATTTIVAAGLLLVCAVVVRAEFGTFLQAENGLALGDWVAPTQHEQMRVLQRVRSALRKHQSDQGSVLRNVAELANRTIDDMDVGNTTALRLRCLLRRAVSVAERRLNSSHIATFESAVRDWSLVADGLSTASNRDFLIEHLERALSRSSRHSFAAGTGNVASTWQDGRDYVRPDGRGCVWDVVDDDEAASAYPGLSAEDVRGRREAKQRERNEQQRQREEDEERNFADNMFFNAQPEERRTIEWLRDFLGTSEKLESHRTQASLSRAVDWTGTTVINTPRSYAADSIFSRFLPAPNASRNPPNECDNSTLHCFAGFCNDTLRDEILRRRQEVEEHTYRTHARDVAAVVRQALCTDGTCLQSFSDTLAETIFHLQNVSGPDGSRLIGSHIIVASKRLPLVKQFGTLRFDTMALLQAWNFFLARFPIPHPAIEPDGFLRVLDDELRLAAAVAEDHRNLTTFERAAFLPQGAREAFLREMLAMNASSFENGGGGGDGIGGRRDQRTMREVREQLQEDRTKPTTELFTRLEHLLLRHNATEFGDILARTAYRFATASNHTAYVEHETKLHVVDEVISGAAFVGVIRVYQRPMRHRPAVSASVIRARLRLAQELASLTGSTSVVDDVTKTMMRDASDEQLDFRYDMATVGAPLSPATPGIPELIEQLKTYDPSPFKTTPGYDTSTTEARKQSSMKSVIEAAITALNAAAEKEPAVSYRNFAAAFSRFCAGKKAGTEADMEHGVPLGYRTRDVTKLELLTLLASNSVLPEWSNFAGPVVNTLPASSLHRLRCQVTKALEAYNATEPMP